MCGYPVKINEVVINFNADNNSTWADLSNCMHGWSEPPSQYKVYGQFAKKVTATEERYIKNNTICPVCKKNACKDIEYLFDIKFSSTWIDIAMLNISPVPGPKTSARISASQAYIRAHEIQHSEDFKNAVLSVVYPVKITFQCCKFASPDEYGQSDDVFEQKVRDLRNETNERLDDALANNKKKAADLDNQSAVDTQIWMFYGSTKVKD